MPTSHSNTSLKPPEAVNHNFVPQRFDLDPGPHDHGINLFCVTVDVGGREGYSLI